MITNTLSIHQLENPTHNLGAHFYFEFTTYVASRVEYTKDQQEFEALLQSVPPDAQFSIALHTSTRPVLTFLH